MLFRSKLEHVSNVGQPQILAQTLHPLRLAVLVDRQLGQVSEECLKVGKHQAPSGGVIKLDIGEIANQVWKIVVESFGNWLLVIVNVLKEKLDRNGRRQVSEVMQTAHYCGVEHLSFVLCQIQLE